MRDHLARAFVCLFVWSFSCCFVPILCSFGRFHIVLCRFSISTGYSRTATAYSRTATGCVCSFVWSFSCYFVPILCSFGRFHTVFVIFTGSSKTASGSSKTASGYSKSGTASSKTWQSRLTFIDLFRHLYKLLHHHC